MKKLLEKIENEKIINSFINKNGSFVLPSFLEEALLIAAAFKKEKKRYLIVKNNLYNAQILYNYLTCFVDQEDVLPFFFDETLRIEAIGYSKELVAQRLFTLNETFSNKPKILITHTLGYVKYIAKKENFINSVKNIKKDQIINREELTIFLTNAGYKSVNKVYNSLEFSKRGSIIDFFGVNYQNPIRIEFFDNVVESIRFFDIDNQRTIGMIDEVTILPAVEFVIKDFNYLKKNIDDKISYYSKLLASNTFEELQENIYRDIDKIKNKESDYNLSNYYDLTYEKDNINDYFNADKIVFIEYDKIKENYDLMYSENYEYREENFFLGKGLKDIKSFKDFSIKENNIICTKKYKENDSDLELDIKSITDVSYNSKMLGKLINDYIYKEYKINIYLNNDNQINSFKNLCHENKINIELIKIYKDNLIEGFEIPKIKEVFFSSKEIYGLKNNISKYFSKYHSAKELSSYEELSKGDYVVHDSYGIGIYRGLETIETNNILKDYLNIEYKNNEKLYVPLEQFSYIRKYVGSDGREPKLNKLGSVDWENTKAKIKRRVKEIAIDLIKLYDERTKKIGFSFSKDDELQEAFESAFVYEPTKDQKEAIKIIKKEMEKDTPMDALLCGDVGFGKTEVAFVAAFKAIKDGKQVAFLCPTTLLSFQHYNNAIERFKSFGIRIEFINRFKTLNEQSKIIKKLKEGEIDLIIGTHRILSSDILFKDLGLLIVDEEQRFGVEHKEKIKEFKNSIDVLTLSATPIPRTLQMSLIGLRTLIQLETPPNDRLPVQTFIAVKNEKVIKEIIERELSRNGQVFYLYNNISNISSLAYKIEKEVKGAKVGYIHGKMDKDIIEEVSKKYYDNELNVLVCTTIIENGIDVSNANTIIVEDAEKFGLAQLYQIKGRVGRGDRLAYAYLLVKPHKQISQVAQDRLRAIKEFSELGSGYKIALKDLSIRGAGDILGARQAGFIENIGMDLYFSMLKEAIEEEKGVVKEKEKNNLKINAKGYIPIDYTQIEGNKIELYKRLEKISNIKQLLAFSEEVEDLYGKMPHDVYLLFEKRKIESILSLNWVNEVKETNDNIDIFLSNELSKKDGIGIVLFNIINEIDFNNISLNFNQENIRIRIRKKAIKWLEYIDKIFNKINESNH